MANNEQKINIEPGVKGVLAKLKSKTSQFRDWILIVSDVTVKNGENMIYCYACVCLDKTLSELGSDDASKTPLTFGYAFHYDFYKPTKEEIKIMKDFLRNRNLKYVKGINKMFDR